MQVCVFLSVSPENRFSRDEAKMLIVPKLCFSILCMLYMFDHELGEVGLAIKIQEQTTAKISCYFIQP